MSDESELLKGNTPMMVLAILCDGPQHTYAIGRLLKERVGNDLTFKRGTLYPILHSLEREELVVGDWETPDGERPRRVYTITNSGKAELLKRIQTWKRFSEAMDRLISPINGGHPDEQPV